MNKTKLFPHSFPVVLCVLFFVIAAPQCNQDQCITNEDCLPAAYCMKAPGDCEGLGTCAERPDACAEIYQPVCGCNEKEYGNACEASAAGVTVLGEKECAATVCDTSRCGPAPGMPNYTCDDGTIGGPTGRCLRTDNETCGWEIRECPH